MTTHLTAKSKLTLAALGALGAALCLSPAWAETYPVTDAQRATADAVAQKGVALADLSDNAPDQYTIKNGDTLWGISSLFLKSPWRWPELWGMNRSDISNPHLIYPGQVLQLERGAGGASLRVRDLSSSGNSGGASSDDSGLKTVRLSPRMRSEAIDSGALPTIDSSYIDAFLAEPEIVDVQAYTRAPRIVAAPEGRVVLSNGDRAYARGPEDALLKDDQPAEKIYRILSNAKPIKHPDTGALLGYETMYEGKARLIRSESQGDGTDADGKSTLIPATIDIISAKMEVNIGDRLIPMPPLQLRSFTPHAPAAQLESRIVSVYGSGVVHAGQKNVVAITGGELDGVDVGTVLAIMKNGRTVLDRDGAKQSTLKLPSERVGLLMVFKTFEHLSYGLILEVSDSVRVGDRLISPR